MECSSHKVGVLFEFGKSNYTLSRWIAFIALPTCNKCSYSHTPVLIVSMLTDSFFSLPILCSELVSFILYPVFYVSSLRYSTLCTYHCIANQFYDGLLKYYIIYFWIFAAPNVYDVPKADKILDNSHKYTFGVKTAIEKPSETPG